MRLNPYHPEWYWLDLGTALYVARHYADAIEAFSHRAPPGYWVLCRLAACYAQLGRTEEAAAATAKALRLRPGLSLSKMRLCAWKTPEAEHILEGMRKAGLPE